MQRTRHLCAIVLAVGMCAGLAVAEVVYLNNGDIIHGELVAANNNEVTLKTAYGELQIPKSDIQRIDYEGAAAQAESAPANATSDATADVRAASPRVSGDRAAITLSITGRSFWYAFDSPEAAPADPSIRLRLYIGSGRACTFVDEKPDTVDGTALYNSFTFSPTDSRLVETLEGFQCSVQSAEDGEVTLTMELPESVSSGRQLVRMVYEVNEGDASFPRWVDVVSRSFSVEVEGGRVTEVILEQDASALEYSGFFKKSMRNVDQFQLSVLSTELRS